MKKECLKNIDINVFRNYEDLRDSRVYGKLRTKLGTENYIEHIENKNRQLRKDASRMVNLLIRNCESSLDMTEEELESFKRLF